MDNTTWKKLYSENARCYHGYLHPHDRYVIIPFDMHTVLVEAHLYTTEGENIIRISSVGERIFFTPWSEDHKPNEMVTRAGKVFYNTYKRLVNFEPVHGLPQPPTPRWRAKKVRDIPLPTNEDGYTTDESPKGRYIRELKETVPTCENISIAHEFIDQKPKNKPWNKKWEDMDEEERQYSMRSWESMKKEASKKVNQGTDWKIWKQRREEFRKKAREDPLKDPETDFSIIGTTRLKSKDIKTEERCHQRWEYVHKRINKAERQKALNNIREIRNHNQRYELSKTQRGEENDKRKQICWTSSDSEDETTQVTTMVTKDKKEQGDKPKTPDVTADNKKSPDSRLKQIRAKRRLKLIIPPPPIEEETSDEEQQVPNRPPTPSKKERLERRLICTPPSRKNIDQAFQDIANNIHLQTYTQPLLDTQYRTQEECERYNRKIQTIKCWKEFEAEPDDIHVISHIEGFHSENDPLQDTTEQDSWNKEWKTKPKRQRRKRHQVHKEIKERRDFNNEQLDITMDNRRQNMGIPHISLENNLNKERSPTDQELIKLAGILKPQHFLETATRYLEFTQQEAQATMKDTDNIKDAYFIILIRWRNKQTNPTSRRKLIRLLNVMFIDDLIHKRTEYDFLLRAEEGKERKEREMEQGNQQEGKTTDKQPPAQKSPKAQNMETEEPNTKGDHPPWTFPPVFEANTGKELPSDDNLLKVAELIQDKNNDQMKHLAENFLKLDQEEVKHIQERNPTNQRNTAFNMLVTWRSKTKADNQTQKELRRLLQAAQEEEGATAFPNQYNFLVNTEPEVFIWPTRPTQTNSEEAEYDSDKENKPPRESPEGEEREETHNTLDEPLSDEELFDVTELISIQGIEKFMTNMLQLTHEEIDARYARCNHNLRNTLFYSLDKWNRSNQGNQTPQREMLVEMMKQATIEHMVDSHEARPWNFLLRGDTTGIKLPNRKNPEAYTQMCIDVRTHHLRRRVIDALRTEIMAIEEEEEEETTPTNQSPTEGRQDTPYPRSPTQVPELVEAMENVEITEENTLPYTPTEWTPFIDDDKFNENYISPLTPEPPSPLDYYLKHPNLTPPTPERQKSPTYATIEEITDNPADPENQERDLDEPTYATIRRSPRGTKRTISTTTPVIPKKQKPAPLKPKRLFTFKQPQIETRPNLGGPHYTNADFHHRDQIMDNIEIEMQTRTQYQFEEAMGYLSTSDSSDEEYDDIPPNKAQKFTARIGINAENMISLAYDITKDRFGSNLRLRRLIVHKIGEIEHLLHILNTELESEV